MKTLSLWQPWASLIAVGAKRIETRGWATSYRGPIAIHAAKRKPDEDDRYLWRKFAGVGFAQDLPLGAIVAIARLVECHAIPAGMANHLALGHVGRMGNAVITMQESALGNYEPGRFGWELVDVRALPEPIPARGAQGLWDWTPPEGFAA